MGVLDLQVRLRHVQRRRAVEGGVRCVVPGLEGGRGHEDLEGRSRRVEVAADGAVVGGFAVGGFEILEGRASLARVMAGQGVRVPAGSRGHGQDLPGLRVERYGSTVLIAQPVPGRLLHLGIDRQLHGRTAGLLTGEEAADLVVEQGVGVTGEVVPGGAFHARGPGHDRVVAGERGVGARVETLGSVLALVLVLVVDGFGIGDRGAVDEDRSAVAGELIEDLPVVERIVVEGIRGDVLDPARRSEQEREHDESDDGDMRQWLLHRSPPAGPR